MSNIRCLVWTVVVCLSLSGTRPIKGFAGEEDLTADKVVAGHLKSIGSPAALAALKSCAFVGTSSANFIQGGHGNMSGTSMFVSEGRKLGIALKYDDINYPGEYFAFDGKEVSVGHISPGQKSPLGEFLFRYNGLIREGLMGGMLSVAWPLQNLQERQVEVKYREATVEGRRLHEIEYRPKRGLGELKIRLYFEPETFHHVRTEYRVRTRDDMSAAPGGGQTRAGKFQQPSQNPTDGFSTLHHGLPDSIYVLVEKFDDFKKVDAIVFPHTYTLYYSVEGQGGSFIAEWTVKALEWAFNGTYDERIFKAQK